MTAVIVIDCLACLGLCALALFKSEITIGKHSVSICWLPPLLGALILLFSGLIDASSTFSALTADTAVNPIKIIALFISMTLISIFLDETGLFKFLAVKTAQRAGTSQTKLFMILYIVISVLTVFTSNDIIILAFTPYICYFAKNSDIDPIPYIVSEFVAANTWSFSLIIGNPTNVYLCGAAGVDFFEFFKIMIIPTLLCGLLSFAALYLIFRKRLKKPLKNTGASDAKIKDKFLCGLGVFHLAASLVFMSVSSYINIDMWLVSVIFAASLYISSSIYCLIKKHKPTELTNGLKRAPWDLAPFVLSMFVLVIALDFYGITRNIAVFLSDDNTVLKYGLLSFLASNVLNNIPMSVLFSSITSFLTGSVKTQAIYASVIGSNLGALFTPVGALAGIMFTKLLKQQNIKYSFWDFIKNGFGVSLASIAGALGGLMLVFAL